MSNTLPPAPPPSSGSGKWPARIVEGVRRRLGYLTSESRKIESASADAVVDALESFATGIEGLQSTLAKVQADFITAQGQLGELSSSVRGVQAVLLTHAARLSHLETSHAALQARVAQLEATRG